MKIARPRTAICKHCSGALTYTDVTGGAVWVHDATGRAWCIAGDPGRCACPPESYYCQAPTSTPTIYTVIGLVRDGRLIVAGVIEGAHKALDTDPGDESDGYRYATEIEADSPDEAAHAADLEVEFTEGPSR